MFTAEQVARAHGMLVRFCEQFENNYGTEYCTPDMHMACHLQQCILDYGPLSSFWCFPYERYNGLLEGLQKSWNGPEKQMLQKFLSIQHIGSVSDQIALDSNVHNEFISTIVKRNTDISSTPLGSYSSFDQTTVQDVTTVMQVKNIDCRVALLDATEKSYQCLVEPLYEKYFSDADLQLLHSMYSLLYPSSSVQHVARFYHEAKQIIINGEEYISQKSRSVKSNLIAAHWPSVSGIDPQGDADLRIAGVKSFTRNEVVVSAPTCTDHDHEQLSTKVHILAKVEWYQDHSWRSFFHFSAICTGV